VRKFFTFSTTPLRSPAEKKLMAAADVAVSPSIFDHLTEESWRRVLRDALASPLVAEVDDFLAGEAAAGEEVFPPRELTFAALNAVPFDKVRVVIIGQDPYHDVGQAHGFSFSVPHGVRVPPSLRNVYKELEAEGDGVSPAFEAPAHGNLEAWADRGVLLLNSTLTVRAHKANSHAKCGWAAFTDAVVEALNAREKPVVFLLWGNFAKKKAAKVDTQRHRVVSSAHPSPLSVRAFTGCRCFSKVDAALKELEGTTDGMDWSLPPRDGGAAGN
jgi:uracil-DNA glycosylase